MKQYDAVILGFGKGGKTLAGYLAGEGQQAHHHTLVGFGRVARQRQCVLGIDAAVDVGDV